MLNNIIYCGCPKGIYHGDTDSGMVHASQFHKLIKAGFVGKENGREN
jgi:hypothetical protein